MVSVPRRTAIALWIVVTILLWNGIYDMILVRGVKEYLFRAALAAAGRGPETPIAQVMDAAVYEAVWIATLWTSFVLLAGMVTIKLVDRSPVARRFSGASEGWDNPSTRTRG
jgi:hypothetical protein